MGGSAKKLVKPIAGAGIGYLTGGPLGALQGAAVGSSLGGGGGGYQSPSGDLLSQISADYYNKSAPLREKLLNQSNAFMSGNYDVTQSPVYGALKNTIESQYGRARENVLSSVPTGGALSGALTGLEAQRAGNLTSAVGGLAEQEMNRAAALGSGSFQQASAGLGAAGGIQGQLSLAQSQQKAQAMSGLGSGLGYKIGRGGGMGGKSGGAGAGAESLGSLFGGG